MCWELLKTTQSGWTATCVSGTVTRCNPSPSAERPVHGFRQVSWLRGSGVHTLTPVNGLPTGLHQQWHHRDRLPHHSGGTAPALHRLPLFHPVWAPQARFGPVGIGEPVYCQAQHRQTQCHDGSYGSQTDELLSKGRITAEVQMNIARQAALIHIALGSGRLCGTLANLIQRPGLFASKIRHQF